MLNSGNFFINLTFILLYFFFSSNAIAEFYSYTDDSGVLYYTDDYSNIPDKFKTQVVVNEKTLTRAVEKKTFETKNLEEVEQDFGVDDNSWLLKEAEELKKRKISLDKEYNILVEKQKSIELFKKGVKTKNQSKKYFEKLEELNVLVKNYEEKRVKFDKDVSVYNEKLNKEKE